jgi:hypothetical protein
MVLGRLGADSRSDIRRVDSLSGSGEIELPAKSFVMSAP